MIIPIHKKIDIKDVKTDHYVINQVVEKYAFIDYEKDFVTVETSIVMEALRKQGIEEIYVKILDGLYKKSTAIIKLHEVSDKIPIQTRRHYFS